MQKSEIFFIYLLIIISSRNFSVRFLPLSITLLYSTKSQESQIKAKRLKVTKNISQNDIINFTLRPNQVLKGQGSSADSMQLANVERVHGYLVPKSCMQIVSCTCRTVAYVTIHANARNMTSTTLESLFFRVYLVIQ